MNPLDYLNNNPGLTSIVAFPLGILILLGVGKLLKLGAIYTEALTAIKEHTAAELKIEERITDVVNRLSDLLANNNDTRQHFDFSIESVVRKVDDLQKDVSTIMGAIKKRRSDWMRPDSRRETDEHTQQ